MRGSEGYFDRAPDITVDVVEPNETYTQVRWKALDYVAAGVRLVWVIDPTSRSAEVHPSEGPGVILLEDAELDGGDVLPGFRCRVGDLLPPREMQEPYVPAEDRE